MKAHITIVFVVHLCRGETVSENIYECVTEEQAKVCADEELDNFGAQTGEWVVVNSVLQKTCETEYHPITEEFLDKPGYLVSTIKFLSE